jgi:hypothetical protein
MNESTGAGEICNKKLIVTPATNRVVSMGSRDLVTIGDFSDITIPPLFL